MSARKHVVIGSVEQLLSVVCIHSRTINDKKTVGSFVSKPASDSEEEVPAVQRQDGTTPPPAAVLLVAIDVLFTVYYNHCCSSTMSPMPLGFGVWGWGPHGVGGETGLWGGGAC